MQALIKAMLVAQAQLASAAPPQTPEPLPPPPAQPPLTDEMIRKVVREMIAEDPRPAAPSGSAGAFGAVTPYSKMSAAFDQARVPDCLHPDALKHQPATLGPVNVVGPYSLPWVIAAALRGKCN